MISQSKKTKWSDLAHVLQMCFSYIDSDTVKSKPRKKHRHSYTICYWCGAHTKKDCTCHEGGYDGYKCRCKKVKP